MDKAWWNWLYNPMMHRWAKDGKPLQLLEETIVKHEANSKAIAWNVVLFGSSSSDTATLCRTALSQRDN